MADPKKFFGGLNKVRERLMSAPDEARLSELLSHGGDKALPLMLPRANLSSDFVNQQAERVARQMLGEHVVSGKPKETFNLAGRSKKESQRVKGLNYKLTPTGTVAQEVPYTPRRGDLKVAVPGDQTVSNKILDEVNGVPIDSVQEGGAYYGLGQRHLDDPEFWKSNEEPAKRMQSKVDRVAELYEPNRVIGSHLAMGPMSNNFAMHFADANLRAIDWSKAQPNKIDIFDSIIAYGYKDPKTKEMVKFPNWPGLADREGALTAMKEDANLRKWFNNRMKTPKVTKPLGLPNGLDIQYAITEPRLRDMEINMTGLMTGELKPGALVEAAGAPHNTYSHRILGKAGGPQEVLTPFVIDFPDAAQHIASTKKPADFTGTIQKVFPHQLVDDQYLNQYGEYRDRIKELTGQKEGGAVDMEAADARLAQAIQARMAKGGAVDMKAADARLQAAIQARMGGEKVAHMAGGGKLKALGDIAKKFLVGSDVLPAAERDANLAKMLEVSKVKKRLYHGTMAHDDYAEKAGQAFQQFTSKPTWLAKEPYTANGYVGKAGSVYPVHAQVKNPLTLNFDANDEASKAFPIAKRFGVDIDHMVSMQKPEYAWQVINDPAFVDAVETAGHDGLLINEGGYKTYGVFDPRKIKSAISNRGTYDITDPDMSKAKGGGVHMAGAGGVFKALGDIGKKFLADAPQTEALKLAQQRAALPPAKGGLGLPADNTPMNKVLPLAERDANLQKFLAPSAEKRRMYHGSKNPNIKAFKTRKEMTNEDNMTGHYADERDAVFLSPEPDFTKNFSIHGYTDTNQAPTTYPVYVQVERPFDFDDPEHLKQVKETYLDMYHNPESEFYDPNLLASERSTEQHLFNKKVDSLLEDENNWAKIENEKFQDILKDIGFDSFYTRERGTKNLGVYEPNRIKSAISNRGTYDLGESDMSKAKGGLMMAGGGDPLDQFSPPRYRSAGRRPESQQDRKAAANMPLDFARGLVSGIGGAPGDIESLIRMLPGLDERTVLPTSEDIEKRLPFRSDTPAGQAASGLGTLAGGFYTGPGAPIRLVGGLPKAVVKAGKDFTKAAGQPATRLDVYHGSPHKYDKFDASKIGTGEGAQAYGHGLYLAEAPEVAKSYQPRSPKFEEKLINLYQKASSASNYPMMEVLEDAMLHRAPSEIIQKFTNVDDGYTSQHAKAAQDFLKWYSKNEPEVGGFYKVDLPDEQIAKMLDWDKPFSEQAPNVQAALKSIVESEYTPKLAQSLNVLSKNPLSHSLGTLNDQLGGQHITATYLQQAGIPGIKYLDEGSRGGGKGTRNFVTFPGEEQSMTILERNGQPMIAPAPEGMAHGGLLHMADAGRVFKDGLTTSGGTFSPEELGVSASDLDVIDDKTWNAIKRNAPGVYEEAKQKMKDEASQLKSAKGIKDFALRVGASYAGAIPDFANFLLMAPDAVFGTELASEKPWFGSQQYLDAMNKAGMLGEYEFPIAETVAGILTPAGLIKKGVKKVGNMRTSKETPKKRRGGLAAMAR